MTLAKARGNPGRPFLITPPHFASLMRATRALWINPSLTTGSQDCGARWSGSRRRLHISVKLVGLIAAQPDQGTGTNLGSAGADRSLSQGDSHDEEELHCHCRGRFARPGNDVGADHGRGALLGFWLRPRGGPG